MNIFVVRHDVVIRRELDDIAGICCGLHEAGHDGRIFVTHQVNWRAALGCQDLLRDLD